MGMQVRRAQWLTAAFGFLLFVGAGLAGRRPLGLSLLIGAGAGVLGWLAPRFSDRRLSPVARALAQAIGAGIGITIAWWWVPHAVRWESVVVLVPISFLASWGMYASLK